MCDDGIVVPISVKLWKLLYLYLNVLQIAVLFYEKKQKKIWFQFSKSEELICWEQWAITITVVDPQTESGTNVFVSIAQKYLHHLLKAVLNYCRTT